MAGSNWLSYLLTQLWAIPYLLIYVVGIVLSVVSWWRHPQVSLLCLIAFILLLGGRLASSGMQLWIMQANDRGTSASQIGTFIGVVSMVQMIFHCTAWVLLLTAMFGWRSARDEKKAF